MTLQGSIQDSCHLQAQLAHAWMTWIQQMCASTHHSRRQGGKPALQPKTTKRGYVT